jgi:hypothetical protein
MLPFGSILRGTGRLAIHSDQLAAADLMNGLNPTEEALDEAVGVQQGFRLHP